MGIHRMSIARTIDGIEGAILIDANGAVVLSSGSTGGGGGATSVWSAADAAANGMTLSNGGLTVTLTTSSWQSIRGSIGQQSGKYYVEFLANVQIPVQVGFGLASASFVATSYLGSSNYSLGAFCNPGAGNQSSPSANIVFNYSITTPAAPGDVWALAVDLTAGKVWLAQNNVWVGGGSPATGATPMATMTSPALGQTYFPSFAGQTTGDEWTLQSTAASQTYAPPSGFVAWDSAAPVVTGHRYWRLNITTAGSAPYSAIAEVQFRTVTGTPLLFSGGMTSSSEIYSTYIADNAADNNPATFWITGVVPGWWAYDYGAGKAVNIVEISMQTRPGAPNQAPQVFTPQWSDDGANWTSMAQITAAPWTTDGQIQTFAVTPAALLLGVN